MWTAEDRARVGDYGAGQSLTDEQFDLIVPFLPPPKRRGRPRRTLMPAVLNALFYLIRTGCQWRHLPPPPMFPPWQTVYGYLRLFIALGVWDQIHHHLLQAVREAEGHEASPTLGILDSQTVRVAEKGGCAAGTPPRRRAGANVTSWSMHSV